MKLIKLSFLIAIIATSCGEAPNAADTMSETKEAPESSESAEAQKNLQGNQTKTARVVLSGCSDSKMLGTVEFTESAGVVKMVAQMSNVNQGMHGFHIHAIGDCSAADGTSAGGHWNPTGVEHGKWGTPPFHKGDIGNFEADKNGIGSIKLKTDLWCIDCGDETKDIVGKSIIVHAGEDDCTSQPSGAAGPRIACGVIEYGGMSK
jgi:Cu-Zn family superoxide dismutase